MNQKPNKNLLVGGLIGLVVLVVVLISYLSATDGDSQDDGMLLGGIFLLIIVDLVNIISYFVRITKYKKEFVENMAIQQTAKELTTLATITFSRGANDGLQKNLSLRVFNNDRLVGDISPKESVNIQTSTSINRLTIAYLNAINGELIPLKKHKLTLELSDGETVGIIYENKKLTRIS